MITQYLFNIKSDRPGWLCYLIAYRDARGRFGRPQYIRTLGMDGVS